MSLYSYANNVGESTDTTGTGTLTLTNTALTQRQKFPAALDGLNVIFGIKSSNETDWEVSSGVYTNSGRTLTRILRSSSTGALLNLSGTGHEVAIIADKSILGKLAAMVDVADEVAITGAGTIAATGFGRMHVCSGTTTDYTLVLPAVSGNTGKMLGFRMASGLTKLVTLDGNAAETIDGSFVRVMWADEVVILYCNGTEWVKVAGKSVPKLLLALTRSGASAQNISDSTWTKVDFEVSSDPYSLWDNTSNYIKALRAGVYNLKLNMAYNSRTWAAGATTRLAIIGGTANALALDNIHAGYTGDNFLVGSAPWETDGTDTNLELQAYQDSGGIAGAKATGDCKVEVYSMGGW